MPKKQSKKQDGGPSVAAAGDSRFANFESDPRFRLPSKRRNKTTIDKRFSRMLKDDDFIASAKVDKYGRRLKSDNKKKALQNIYQEEEEEEKEKEEGQDVEEVDEDDVVQRELRKADAKYDPARGGGFSSSESDSDSDEEDDQDEEEGGAEVDTSGSMQRLRDAQADVETGDVTRRIAIVNLDWDHIKSADLMALFSSFAPKGGRIERISIYPSQFGKERMQREELEGPPREIFKKSSGSRYEESESDFEDDSEDDDEEDDEKIKNDIIKEGDDQDFDSDALRAYQLDRLRYYYAVMVCSDTATAEKIYQATDGTEYQSSSNFMDLRFVPDDVTFDDEPRDKCDVMSSDYKPTEFTTDALQHSKVKLTWDIHPAETSRREDIKRAFSASRAELEENDLRAYLASDSDDDGAQEEEEGEEDQVEVADDQPKLTKKELKAKKLREALGLGSESARSSKSGPVGDMQITFSAALMDNNDKKKKEPDAEETTLEKYKRKERERKAQKKEKALAKRNGAQEEVDDEPTEQEDLGFDDPFFTTDEPVKKSKSSEKKEERRKRREAKEAEAAENAAQRAQLEKLLADDSKETADHLDHFDMNEIARAEKQKSKKHKKKGKKEVEDHGGLQHGFEMDVGDDRFKAVFESHEFAIDPSNPRYKATQGMKQILEERSKKRKDDPDALDGHRRQGGRAKKQKR
ncbi:pre-rRNA-processing protein esf1 [Parahypoxylon ruwenzoriense]